MLLRRFSEEVENNTIVKNQVPGIRKYINMGSKTQQEWNPNQASIKHLGVSMTKKQKLDHYGSGISKICIFLLATYGI
jgi:hypothetical protein